MASKYRLVYLAMHCCSKLQLRAVAFRTCAAEVVIASAFNYNPKREIMTQWRNKFLLYSVEDIIKASGRPVVGQKKQRASKPKFWKHFQLDFPVNTVWP